MASNFFDSLDFSPQMIGQQLAKVLTDAIVTNEIRGGEKLVEHQLQKKFGVSRSPIREAIRDLEKIGLVEIIPRKGTVVKKITRKAVREDYFVRAALEGLAAKEAHSKMGKRDFVRLETALITMRSAAKIRNVTEYWHAHADFHDTFITASGNELLGGILRVLRIHSLRARLVYPYLDEDLDASLETHEVIQSMFGSPDTDIDELEKFVSRHIIDVLPGFIANVM